MSYKKLIAWGVGACAVVAATICFAKDVNLYDQPNTTAKVIGSIDPAIGVVPIFTSQDGVWMKVGDPRNGNVGWVKSAELNPSTGNTGFSFSQEMTNNGKGPGTYVIKFGMPPQLTKEQSDRITKQIQMQQQAIQNDLQQIVRDIYNNTSETMMNMPFVVPVVVVPQQPAGAVNAPASAGVNGVSGSKK